MAQVKTKQKGFFKRIKPLYFVLAVLSLALLVYGAVKICADNLSLLQDFLDKNDKKREEQQNTKVRQEEQSNEQSEKICADECSSDICKGHEYHSCLKKEDGCYDQINKGKVKGKCGVECTHNNDCKEGQECSNNNCICEDECISDSCRNNHLYKCITLTNSCRELDVGHIIKGECGVECKTNSDCRTGEECSSYKCKDIELICDDETEILRNGRCESCGDMGEQCCTEDSCMSPDSICTNHVCEPCGNEHKTCCSIERCFCDRDGGPPCFCSDNVCEIGGCGMMNEPCCDNECPCGGFICGCIDGICRLVFT